MGNVCVFVQADSVSKHWPHLHYNLSTAQSQKHIFVEILHVISNMIRCRKPFQSNTYEFPKEIKMNIKNILPTFEFQCLLKRLET